MGLWALVNQLLIWDMGFAIYYIIMYRGMVVKREIGENEVTRNLAEKIFFTRNLVVACLPTCKRTRLKRQVYITPEKIFTEKRRKFPKTELLQMQHFSQFNCKTSSFLPFSPTFFLQKLQFLHLYTSPQFTTYPHFIYNSAYFPHASSNISSVLYPTLK